MRQAADILASPAAMQIRQLEALQQMAKSADSKVIFVPMNLQGDVSNALVSNAHQAQASGSGMAMGSEIGRTAVINSMTDI